MSIFKACDIRGAFGTELTLEHAHSLGRAIAQYARPEAIVVGGDGRLSTPALKQRLMDSLVGEGVKVVDIGMVPTPAFYFARKHLGIQAGVMVTASHNPAQDNGFKIVLGDLPLKEEELAEIAALMSEPRLTPQTARGICLSVEVLEDYGSYVIQSAGFGAETQGAKVVLDCANGVMALVAPKIFRQLGWNATPIFDDVDGAFPNHPPNPAVFANLRSLQTEVIRQSAMLGVGYDGDGDRTVFVDEKGDIVESDAAIVLFAKLAVLTQPGALVVYDQKCSDVVRESVEAAGGVARLERSGYAFIKTALLRDGAAYAGEASGHHFFGDIGGDDGLIASLRMASILLKSGRTMSELVDEIPRYPITPDMRIPVPPGKVADIVENLRKHLTGRAEISELDGIRARFADGWGLVRPSVTEPVITVRVEGRTSQALERIKREFVGCAPELSPILTY